MLRKKFLVVVSSLFLLGVCPVAAQPRAAAAPPPLTRMPPEAQKHMEAANAIADKNGFDGVVGQLFNNIRRENYITPSLLPPAPAISHPAKPGLLPLYPFLKLFDQFYYFGNVLVGAYVLNTPDGIILIDAMSNDWQAENIVEAGLKANGLDPSKIRYIMLTHGHGDHYGGVPYFTRKYPNIRVVSADWDLMRRTAPTANPNNSSSFNAPPVFRPGRDIAVKDGEKIALGGYTVTTYILPGHTPQSVGIFVPVTDRGTKHMVAVYGGLALSPQLAPTDRDGGLDASDASLDRLLKVGDALGMDVLVSVHPDFTNAAADFEKLINRKPGEPNPFVMGKARIASLVQIIKEMSVVYRSIMATAAEVSKK